jgi:hypothetical protein
MNVAELIEYLQTLDPTIRVVTAASEDGYFDIDPEDEEPFDLILNAQKINPKRYWKGPHKIHYGPNPSPVPTVKAICL